MQMRDPWLGNNTLKLCSNTVPMETFQSEKNEEEEKKEKEGEKEKKKHPQLLLLAMRCQHCRQAARQAASAC